MKWPFVTRGRYDRAVQMFAETQELVTKLSDANRRLAKSRDALSYRKKVIESKTGNWRVQIVHASDGAGAFNMARGGFKTAEDARKHADTLPFEWV